MTSTAQHIDPIVAEIHAAREDLATRHQGDLAAYSRAAEAHCLALGFHLEETRRGKRRREREPLPA